MTQEWKKYTYKGQGQSIRSAAPYLHITAQNTQVEGHLAEPVSQSHIC